MKLFRISAFLLAAMLGGAAAQAQSYTEEIMTTDRVSYTGYISYQDPENGTFTIQASSYICRFPKADCHDLPKSKLFSELTPELQEAYANYIGESPEELNDRLIPLCKLTILGDTQKVIDNALRLETDDVAFKTYVIFNSSIDISMDDLYSVSHTQVSLDDPDGIIDVFTLANGEEVEGMIKTEISGVEYEVLTLDEEVRKVKVDDVVCQSRRTVQPDANILDCAPIRNIIKTVGGEYIQGYIISKDNTRERMVVLTEEGEFKPVRYEEIKTIRTYPAGVDPKPSWVGKKEHAASTPTVRKTEPEPDNDIVYEYQDDSSTNLNTAPAQEEPTYTGAPLEPEPEKVPAPSKKTKGKKPAKNDQTTDAGRKIGGRVLEDIQNMNAEEQTETQETTIPVEDKSKNEPVVPVETPTEEKTSPVVETPPATVTPPRTPAPSRESLPLIEVPISAVNAQFLVCGSIVHPCPVRQLPDGSFQMDGDCTKVSSPDLRGYVTIDFPANAQNEGIEVYVLGNTQIKECVYEYTFSVYKKENKQRRLNVSAKNIPPGHKRYTYQLKRGNWYAIYRPSDGMIMWFEL